MILGFINEDETGMEHSSRGPMQRANAHIDPKERDDKNGTCRT